MLFLQNATRHLVHTAITANVVRLSSSAACLIKKPPVVTIMGHVDHGKTTLLDHLRNSQIVKQEFGGITQHIGAFVVPFKQINSPRVDYVTFLDTPGHAAFAAMRQRGANITDIVVLVVACDDGVLEQTVESIKYAKNARVPIIVAVNKIDKLGLENTSEIAKRVNYVRQELIVHDVVSEADGGDVQVVNISASTGHGINELKEAILALAETLDLQAETDCPVGGYIIESTLDPHRGKLSTILVQRGRLVKGCFLVSGTNNWARVRALFDERGQLRQSCEPGLPIQVAGWREHEPPKAGDPVIQVGSEAGAKEIIHRFKQEKLEQKASEDSEAAEKRQQEFYKIYKQNLIDRRERGYRYGRMYLHEKGIRPKESIEKTEDQERKINLILKCDVDGSLDAMLELLDSYDRDGSQPVKLDLMQYGVGSITENDFRMAASFANSLIYGFNVKFADPKLFTQARKEGVEVKLFNVIYNLVDDLKARLAAKLPELEKQIEIGRANVLQEFVVEEKRKRVHVAGCRCMHGTLKRADVFYKLIRNNEVLADDMPVLTLKHVKDHVKQIERGNECGISFEGHEHVEFKLGDVLVCYEKQRYKPKLKWDLRGF